MSKKDLNQSNWYVLQTKAHAEMILNQLIESNKLLGLWDITSYLPKVTQGKKEVPLFKRYLFVHHDDSGFHQLKYQPGVKGYVRFGGLASKISSKDIELMKQVEKLHNGASLVQSFLVSGMRVKITKGILVGYTGTLMTKPNGKKVALAIENIGYSLLIHVPLSDLLLLEEPHS